MEARLLEHDSSSWGVLLDFEGCQPNSEYEEYRKNGKKTCCVGDCDGKIAFDRWRKAMNPEGRGCKPNPYIMCTYHAMDRDYVGFCPNGHDLLEVGTTDNGACRGCARERRQKRKVRERMEEVTA